MILYGTRWIETTNLMPGIVDSTCLSDIHAPWSVSHNICTINMKPLYYVLQGKTASIYKPDVLWKFHTVHTP